MQQLEGASSDDVAAAHDEFDIDHALTMQDCGPSSALTLADIVASSTVRTLSRDHASDSRCAEDDDAPSDTSSSGCSTVTGTTVRTVVTRSATETDVPHKLTHQRTAPRPRAESDIYDCLAVIDGVDAPRPTTLATRPRPRPPERHRSAHRHPARRHESANAPC